MISWLSESGASDMPFTTVAMEAWNFELTEAYLCERFGARGADGAGALARFEQSFSARGGLRPSG